MIIKGNICCMTEGWTEAGPWLNEATDALENGTPLLPAEANASGYLDSKMLLSACAEGCLMTLAPIPCLLLPSE